MYIFYREEQSSVAILWLYIPYQLPKECVETLCAVGCRRVSDGHNDNAFACHLVAP